MKTIFEKISDITDSLFESKISVHKDLSTKEQGESKAYKDFAKYFLNSGSGPSELNRDDDIDVPDDFIDPKFKEEMNKHKDKSFKSNKLEWDKDEDKDKLEKEVNDDGEEDDEFDDFDYKDNPFGDEDDDDELDGDEDKDEDERTEDEKLKDGIKDTLNDMKDDKESGDEEQGSAGSSSTSDELDSTEDSGEDSLPDDSAPKSSSKPMNNSGSQHGTKRDKKIKDIEDAIDNGEEWENDQDGESGEYQEMAGMQKDIDDEAVRKAMENAHLSEEEIEEILKRKNDDTSKEENEQEKEKEKEKIIGELEKKCPRKGGSALATTIAKAAAKKTLENMEWNKLLEIFLTKHSETYGDRLNAPREIKFGNKNHLWRRAILPTYGEGKKGDIQTIYCFIDFSGSVNQSLVYTFLGKVIDLCMKLDYTDIIVYGFGVHIVKPQKINGQMVKSKGREVVLSELWSFIEKQYPGPNYENFEDVATTIKELWRKNDNSVFLVFGDGLWSLYGNPYPPRYLKDICPRDAFDSICALVYYTNENNSETCGEIGYLKDIVKLKHIITTKASNLLV